MTFVKSIEDAQKMPELPEELASQIPDLLSGAVTSGLGTRVVTDVKTNQIKGIPEYAFEYNCARLIIGPIETGYSQGHAVNEDVDDSDRLKEIMDMNLQAEAIIFTKETTFLKSGAVIIWIEWGTPKTSSKTTRDFLTEQELRSPKSPKSEDDDGDSEDPGVVDYDY